MVFGAVVVAEVQTIPNIQHSWEFGFVSFFGADGTGDESRAAVHVNLFALWRFPPVSRTGYF